MMQGCRAVHRFGRERRFPGLIKPAPPHRPTSGCVVIQDLSNPGGLNLTASLACRSPPVTKLGPNLMKSFRPASAGGWARCTDPMTTRLEPVFEPPKCLPSPTHRQPGWRRVHGDGVSGGRDLSARIEKDALPLDQT